MGMRLSGVVLRVDGGEAAQKTLDEVSNAMRKNRAEMGRLDAAWGKGSQEAEYLAQRGKLLEAQLKQQQRATQALREMRDKYAASGNANAAQLEKLDMQLLRAETEEVALTRQLKECNKALVAQGSAGKMTQSALSDMGSAMSRSRAEMEKLDAAWGKGSKDVEYLTQRSKLLGQQLEQQHQVTQALQKAWAEYAASDDMDPAQLEKLDDQIMESEIEEAKLTRQVMECNKALAAQRGAGQTAAAGVDTAADAAKKGAKSWQEYAAQLEKTGKTMESVGRGMQRYLTLPILGMGVTAGTLAVDLEDSLYEVATLPGVLTGTQEQKKQQLEAYRAALLDASNLSHTAATELAAAQYQAVSAGISPAESVYWAQRAAIAAKGGRTDAETVINGASSVYNAWKSGSGGLDHILDVMMTAQNRGKTDVGQLAQYIGQVSGLAPQLGVGMEEVFAAVAAMTLGGSTTSSSFTGLKAVLSSVVKPTSEAREEAERLGLSFDAAALQAQGLTGFLQSVASATGMDVESLGKLFGSVEGLNEVLALGTSAAADYASILQEMRSASGVVDAAFETRTASRAEQLAASMNRLKNAGAGFGEALLPAVDMGAELLENVSGFISGMDEGTQRAVIGLGAVVAAAGPAVKLSGALLSNLKLIFGIATNPYVAVAAGMLGIGALSMQLLDANTTADNLNAALSAMSVSISPESKQAIARGIEEGIAQADKDFTVLCRAKLAIDNADEWEAELTRLAESTTKDRRITFGEYEAWQAMLEGSLMPYAQAASGEGGLLGEVGTALVTATDELNTLLGTVYRAGNSATKQEIRDLETAIARVQELVAEMQGLRSDIDLAGQAMQSQAGTAVAGGYGTTETVAQAAGYVAEMSDKMKASIDQQVAQAYSDFLTVAGSAQASEAEKAQAQADYDRAVEAAQAQKAAVDAAASAELTAQWQGWAEKNGDALAQVQAMGAMLDFISAMDYIQSAEDVEDSATYLREHLPAGTFARMGFAEMEDAQGLWAPKEGHFAYNTGLVYDKAAQMLKEYAESEGMKDNPMIVMAQSWLDAGLDPAALAPGQMPEDIIDALRLLMGQADPESIGTEAMEQLGEGLTEGGSEVEEDAADTAGKVGAALKSMGDLRAVGMGAALDVAAGIQAGTADAVAAAQRLAAAVSAALQGTGAGYGGAGSSGGLVSGSVDHSVNVTIEHADMRSEQDIRSLAGRISTYTREQSFGYGQG